MNICRHLILPGMLVAVLTQFLVHAAAQAAGVVRLQKGDHVCLVGNGLGERLQFTNDWEALLQQRFPDLELTVRNLCFPADEPFKRDRSLNFGSPDDHLKHSKADVILFFFGANESFAGQAGLARFSTDLRRLIEETKTKDYSGRGAPRMVLISPIAHEDLKNPNISNGIEHNLELARYTEAMRQVAAKSGIGFVDLFSPTKALFQRTTRRLTINGFHLSDEGYRELAPLLDESLFGSPPAGPVNRRLRETIDDKNFHWWHRYRAVNGYSIYGTRGLAGSDGTYRNRDVMERERAVLDEMCAIRDRRIWDLAAGKPVPEQIDDSGTLPFIEPKTNVGGPDDPNRRAGKLGSLDYIPAAEQQKMFKLAPGYEIQLVASEEDFPELANPVALNFDNKGRLWVATMPSYPQWKPKTKMDDKLLILEDTNGDGRADVCKVFADGLHQPTGFEIGHGGVFVAQQPDVLYMKDTDGDDRADTRIRRLTGFDTADSHHGISAFEWGPDGALYFQEGTFKQSQVESAYGPVRLGDAGLWRYEPRTEKLNVHVSLAFANPWGHTFDRWGQNFIADASPGFNYWAAPISGRVEHPDKHAGGSRAKNLDWGGSRSNREMPPFLKKRMRPSSGCEFVSSRNFPEEAQGNLLVNNVIGDLGTLQYTMRDENSGFNGDEIAPLVLSEHGNFRPVDLQFGPDGALYLVDWHNALIGHLQHNLREPHRDHSHGRIWRIFYKDRPLLTPPKIAGRSVPELLALLREPEDRTRYRVRRELAERPTSEVIAAVESWLAKLPQSDPQFELLLLEGLWLYQTHNVVPMSLQNQLLQAKDFRARAAATRALSIWPDRIPNAVELLEARIHDPHPRVRLEAVRALSFIPTQRSIELALDVLTYDMDYYLDYTLDETLRAIETSLSRARPVAHEADHSKHAEHKPSDGQASSHSHGQLSGPKPVVLLDKSPSIVSYQLRRLPPSRLLLVDRAPTDPRSVPVYAEILTRSGVGRRDREDSIAALNALRGSTPIQEITSAMGKKDSSGNVPDEAILKQLAGIVLQQPKRAIEAHSAVFQQAIRSDVELLRAVGFAGLIASQGGKSTWDAASPSPQGRVDFLKGLMLLPDVSSRAGLRNFVVECLDTKQSDEVQIAALHALAFVPEGVPQNVSLAARAIETNKFRPAAVTTLLQFPPDQIQREDANRIVRTIVQRAENTPAARRTTDQFLDGIQLCDRLLARLTDADAREFRKRLRDVAVRVIRINTVHEEMRYDTPYFAVEAGRPVQLILRNEDLMPHNLVVTASGAMRDIALLAGGMTSQVDKDGRAYVPADPRVLFATRMVDPHRQDVLNFTAPETPGEYPFVCTFPNHWMRMYGVMIVVPDLDKWQASPTKPVDPLGMTRDFVQSWKLSDFDDPLSPALRGRSAEIGQRIFQEATCVLCHKLKGTGGAVGPDLTDVFKRLKGDHRALLRELLDPSAQIDPKFALYNVELNDGRRLSGIITDQNAEEVTLISNPEKPQPQTISREDIAELTRAPTSLMPKGILDRFSRDEILELMALLQSGQ